MSSDAQPNERDYREKQSLYLRHYVSDFDDWYKSLTPAQRRCLNARGIEGALVEGAGRAGRDEDAASLPAASFSEDLGARIDTLADEIAEKFGIAERTAVPLAGFLARAIEREALVYKAMLFQKVCGEFLNAKNPKLLAAGLAFAANLAALNGLKSQRDYARRIHVTPAALSKVTKKWQRELGLTTSAHMKNEAACQSYSKIQSGDRHWRKQKAKGT